MTIEAAPIRWGFGGKIAVVTGGGSGIGRATALAFAEQGAAVVVGDRDLGSACATLQMIEDQGGEGLAVAVDVGVEAEVAGLMATAMDRFGRIDFLFNNAGVSGIQGLRLAQVDEQTFDEVLRVNVKGVWLGMKHAIPAMLAGGGGAIVNNASMLGWVTQDCKAAYVASKHAVIGLTKSGAIEYGLAGVRVNAVCPGGVETDSTNRYRATFAAEDWDARARAAYPATGAWARPGQIASVVMFLCSAAASHIHGTAILADGGYVAQ